MSMIEFEEINIEIEEHDERGNLTYEKTDYGLEYWFEYDENNNVIYRKNSIGDARWFEFDENNNLIHFKTNYGKEEWYKSDELNDQIRIAEKEYKEIQSRKKEQEYLDSGNSSIYDRSEILDLRKE